MATSQESINECQFVAIPEEPCYICGTVVKRPTLTSCCENKYCHECIAVYQQRGQPCPTCKQRKFSLLAPRMSLKALGVPCSLANRGCQWIGSPDQLEAHLDPNLDNCQYLDTQCPQNCHQVVPRNELEQHTKKECPKRMFKCHYCPFTGTYMEVSELHMSKCRYAPSPTPSVCETVFYVPPAGSNVDASVLSKKISEHFDEVQKTVKELRQSDSESCLVLKSSFTDEEPKYSELEGKQSEPGEADREPQKYPDSVQKGTNYKKKEFKSEAGSAGLDKKNVRQESAQTEIQMQKESKLKMQRKDDIQKAIISVTRKTEQRSKTSEQEDKPKKTLDECTETKPDKERMKSETSKKFAEKKDLEEVEAKLRVELSVEYEKLTKDHEIKMRELERQIEEHKKNIESQRQSIGETERRIMEHLNQLGEPSDKTDADAKEKMADRDLLERFKRSLEEQDKKILAQERKLTQHGMKIEKQNKTLKKLRIASLSEGKKVDTESHGKALEKQMESLERELIDSFKELERKYSEVSTPAGLCTSTDLSNISLGMRREFEVKNYTGTPAYTSPAMYTHLCGYRFCISVGSFLTGDLFAEVVVTPGEFDEQLKWPVTAEFSLKLLNQRGGEDMVCTSPAYSWVRPKIVNVRLGYFGRVNPNTFLQHWELKDYLVDETLHFVIAQVQLK